VRDGSFHPGPPPAPPPPTPRAECPPPREGGRRYFSAPAPLCHQRDASPTLARIWRRRRTVGRKPLSAHLSRGQRGWGEKAAGIPFFFPLFICRRRSAQRRKVLFLLRERDVAVADRPMPVAYPPSISHRNDLGEGANERGGGDLSGAAKGKRRKDGLHPRRASKPASVRAGGRGVAAGHFDPRLKASFLLLLFASSMAASLPATLSCRSLARSISDFAFLSV